jgi:hypothetical protein
MSPPEPGTRRCPRCLSPRIITFGYEYKCEICFKPSRGYSSAERAFEAEFRRRDTLLEKVRHPFMGRFARVARGWDAYTKQELGDLWRRIHKVREADQHNER